MEGKTQVHPPRGRAAKRRPAFPYSAQQTIPYRQMYKDGVCRVDNRLFTKSVEFEDITYQLAHADDQAGHLRRLLRVSQLAFDSAPPFQLSFINRRFRRTAAIVSISPCGAMLTTIYGGNTGTC